MKIFEAITEAVVAETGGPIFAVSGDGNLDLLSAFEARGSQIVNARHEAAAVAMADGYSRASGKVGVATVTCGPGLSQVGTSLMAASRNRSNVVVIAGDTPRRDEIGMQDFDQAAFARASGAGAVDLLSGADVGKSLSDAFARARLARGPVVVNAPLDVQKEDFPWIWEYSPRAVDRASGVVPTGKTLDRLTEIILSHKRAIFVGGRGLHGAEGGRLVAELADRVGALLATTLPARGLFYGHDYDLGVVGAFSSSPTDELFASCDLVVAFGASLHYYTTEGGFLFPDADIVRLDIEQPTGSAQDPPAHALHVQGDAAGTARELLSRIPPGTSEGRGYRTEDTRALLGRHHGTRVKLAQSEYADPRELMRLLSPALPEGALVVCGAGHFWSFYAMYAAPTHEVIFSYQFGAIGQTLPIAIGAAMADPSRPILVIEGDGSLMMHVQELDTAARYANNVVVLVMNDGGFGAEYHKLNAQGKNGNLALYGTPDFGKVAEGLGCRDGGVVRDATELPSRLRDAFDGKGATVVNALLDRAVISDPYLRLHFGEENQAPRLSPNFDAR